ncbi:acyltransferase [uncultured Nocardioides sp.]|uniref:acyltransferase family protein n=1 Tax=uncultured Nocardioides sp. TaxID=198441 RepID=UPI00260E4722|nr:acyltransferase [uncultured Nocardioides sp.]
MSTVDLRHQFPVLDTWRAVGALAVLTTHTTFQTGTYLGNGIWGTLLARLDVGVAIFFVLSGFLLSRPWFARAALGLPAPDRSRYFLKRFLRIYPVYLVTVVLALTVLEENDGTSASTWVANLLVADTYVHDQLPHALTHMWSLTVEVGFYLLLPLLMALCVGARRPTLHRLRTHLVLLSMVATAVLWHTVLVEQLDPRVGGAPGLWLPGYLGWFAAGIWLALAHVDLQQGRSGLVLDQVARLGALPGTCWVMVAGLMLVAATPIAGPVMFVAGTPAQTLVKNLLYTAIGALIVLSGVLAHPERGFSRFLASRPLRHLGHISYSMFCIHLFVLALVFELTAYDVFSGSGLQVWTLTLLVTLVASELLYRFVEKPFMRLAVRRAPDTSSAASAHPVERATTQRS